jgi:hypothetical protein
MTVPLDQGLRTRVRSIAWFSSHGPHR